MLPFTFIIFIDVNKFIVRCLFTYSNKCWIGMHTIEPKKGVCIYISILLNTTSKVHARWHLKQQEYENLLHICWIDFTLGFFVTQIVHLTPDQIVIWQLAQNGFWFNFWISSNAKIHIKGTKISLSMSFHIQLERSHVAYVCIIA